MSNRLSDSDFEEYSYTNWHNPTEFPVTVKLWRGPETDPKKWVHLKVPAKGTVKFPSEYDDAICKRTDNGIVTGKAQQLVKLSDADLTKTEDRKTEAKSEPAKVETKPDYKTSK